MENNVERNQDNGRGVFYAVIGVATLVITLIGATFAYLSASTNSAPNAVQATGATITLGYSDVTTGIKQNLIPIDTDLEQFAKGTFTNTAGETYNFSGIDAKDCRDVNGNNICSVYQFTISNPDTNTVSQYIYGTLEIGANSFENLYFAVFKGSNDEVKATTNGYKLTDTDTPVTAYTTDYTYTNYTKNANDATRKHVIANKGDLVVKKTLVPAKGAKFDFNQQLNQYLDVNESMTYTIILWVDETGEEQNKDQGGKFAATVRFTTAGDGTGVTGDLTASSGI